MKKICISVDAPNNIIGQMKRGGFQVFKSGNRMVIKVGTFASDPLKTTIEFTEEKQNDDATSKK